MFQPCRGDSSTPTGSFELELQNAQLVQFIHRSSTLKNLFRVYISCERNTRTDQTAGRFMLRICQLNFFNQIFHAPIRKWYILVTPTFCVLDWCSNCSSLNRIFSRKQVTTVTKATRNILSPGQCFQERLHILLAFQWGIK